jgi:hypothetical protein
MYISLAEVLHYAPHYNPLLHLAARKYMTDKTNNRLLILDRISSAMLSVNAMYDSDYSYVEDYTSVLDIVSGESLAYTMLSDKLAKWI